MTPSPKDVVAAVPKSGTPEKASAPPPAAPADDARAAAPGRQASARRLGVGVFVLLLSLGHIGTAVPLLLTWLVIDWCPARWYVPVAVGLLLTWVLIADPLVLLVGVVPLAAVCAVRVARELARRQDTPVQAVLRARWHELSLAVAAIAAQGLASLGG